MRGFVGLVCLKSSRSSSGLLFSAGVFASRVPLCVRVRDLAHLVFYGRENKCVTIVEKCRGG